MKRLIGIIVVFGLMALSFRAGQRTDMFMQFTKYTPNSPSPIDAPLSTSGEKEAIADTLRRQANAWNRGDIDSFMLDYWKSEKLRFASGGTVKYGWQTTSDRYKARYPDKATMGTLAFTDLEISVLSPVSAIVFGRWRLTRAVDSPNGLFTLHMRKENDRWIIVSDHTSSSD